MNLPFSKSTPFLDLSDLLTAYRLSKVLLVVEESGLLQWIGDQGAPVNVICAGTGWNQEYGLRFLRCLCQLGLLTQDEERFMPSPFTRQFLTGQGPNTHGVSLEFEQKLHRNWLHLNETLQAGCRVTGLIKKTPQEQKRATALYLGAMDEAAQVRSHELWQAFSSLPPAGTLLDIGAGSGAYLVPFLAQHPQWQAIYCDLPATVAAAELHHNLHPFEQQIQWCGSNLLDPTSVEFAAIQPQSCSMILLSNVIHCQGTAETSGLLHRVIPKLKDNGVIILHDFFLDRGWRGALYDLHMMINTHDGRAYDTKEIITILHKAGLPHTVVQELPSASTLLVAGRRADSLDIVQANTLTI